MHKIGAVLLALSIIFIIGHIWFYIVEGALGRLKRLFCRQETGTWHTLPAEDEKKEAAADSENRKQDFSEF